MKLAYVSDQRYYKFENDWYTAATFPLEELSLALNCNEWCFFGRLIELEKIDQSLHKIVIPLNLKVTFKGVNTNGENTKRFKMIWKFKDLIYNLSQISNKYDIYYLKLPFIASIVFSLMIKNKESHIVLTQLVGDPEMAITATMGKKYKLFAKIFAKFCRISIKRSDYALFVSENLMNKYSGTHNNAYVLNESRVRDSYISEPKKCLNTSKIKILYLGRLSPEKNIESIIETLYTFKFDKEIQFDIYGSGPLEGKLKSMINKNGLKNSVNIKGKIQWSEELFNIINNYTVLILPSETEGLPLVLIEAMSQGVPCIASDIGGIPEIIQNGYNGYLIKPGNINEIKKALEEVIESPDKYVELSENCILTAKQFTLESQMKKLENLFY